MVISNLKSYLWLKIYSRKTVQERVKTTVCAYFEGNNDHSPKNYELLGKVFVKPF